MWPFLISGEYMSRKITDDEIGKEIKKAINRLEIATDIIKAWVIYMNSHLSPSEKLLVERSKEFLGEKK
tara:strand:- start:43 stop:249 length:207 start_codon:yes stop_codon:yes gene_type:complete